MGQDTKDKWFQAIFAAMPLTSVIIFIWFPLFFVLAPGEWHRMMGGVLYTLLVVVSSLLYAIVLAFISTRHSILKMLAIAALLMPTVFFISGAMGHPPAP